MAIYVITYALSLRHDRYVRALQQRRFGRYTAQEAIDLANPILQAILPNRDDLSVTADSVEGRSVNGQLHPVWNVDYIDSNGDYLVHVVRDASSGAICWVGYDTIGRSTTAHPIPLSPSSVEVEGQRWMRILGFTEKWARISTEKHRARGSSPLAYEWTLMLQRPGWRAKLTFDERAGTLVYANIVPTQ